MKNLFINYEKNRNIIKHIETIMVATFEAK